MCLPFYQATIKTERERSGRVVAGGRSNPAEERALRRVEDFDTCSLILSLRFQSGVILDLTALIVRIAYAVTSGDPSQEPSFPWLWSVRIKACKSTRRTSSFKKWKQRVGKVSLAYRFTVCTKAWTTSIVEYCEERFCCDVIIYFISKP